MTKVQITKQGLETLKVELDNLVNVKRPKLVDRLSNARSQGDLTENSDYHNAKDELELLDGRIEELQEVVSEAVVVQGSTNGNGIAIGTKVTVRVNGQSMLYHIVGEWEADPMQKKISHTSPLGQALVGKGKGDSVEVEAPVGKVKYEIVSVE
jgi:transcription elongation factor GreA